MFGNKAKTLAVLTFAMLTTKLFAADFSSYIIKIDNAAARSEVQKIVETKPAFVECEAYWLKKSADKLFSSEQKANFEELRKYFVVNISESEIINNLSHINNVELYPNYKYRAEKISVNDPDYDDQWALKNVYAEKAWETATGAGVIVGVLDTGTDFEHPDLIENLWINAEEDANGDGKFQPWSIDETIDGETGDFNGIDDDENGFVDDVIGYDFVDQTVMNIGDYATRDPIPNDEHGHGTSIAGVIAATQNNGIGVSGLAYNAKIMTLKALDAGGAGETDDIAAAFVYGALSGAKVINASFGEPVESPIMRDAIEFAYSLGCVITTSAGNSGSDDFHYPSDYSECVSVGASDEENYRYWKSSFGSRLDLLAPGVSILTTSRYGEYRTATGTSLSAPMAASVAAMLLEMNPNMSPESVRGAMQSSANDAGDAGWDVKYGAGILNADAALKEKAETNIEILYPKNEATVNKSNMSTIPIVANVIAPLFESYQVFIGEGANPSGTDENLWVSLSEVKYTRVLNDTLIVADISSLKDTVHCVRIVVKLKNGGVIERRSYLNIASDDAKIEIANLKVFYPYYKDKRIVFIAFESNKKGISSVKFKPKNGDEKLFEVANIDRAMKNVSIPIFNNPFLKNEMQAVAVCSRNGSDTAFYEFEFAFPDEAFGLEKFESKEYTMPPSYICDETSDFYGEGKPVIAMNEFHIGYYGLTYLYQFNNGCFVARDSIQKTLIPVAMGDSNGDGIMELLTFLSGETFLYQPSSQGGFAFEMELFRGGGFIKNFWAADLADIDGDGLDDIIAYSDTSVFAYSYKNGKYLLNGLALNEPPYRKIGTFPGIAIGDYDNDGAIELCHGSPSGNLFFFEHNGSEFVKIGELLSDSYDDENQYLRAADIDGDGVDEIIAARISSSELFENQNYSSTIWRIRIIKKIGTEYREIFSDHVFGVRGGVAFKHGVFSADLDGEPGEEIVFSPFPNLYIFKWEAELQELKPFHWRPLAYANSAVAYDFDGNGAIELGFSAGNYTEFIEYRLWNKGPDAPDGFKGWAINQDSAYFKWNEAEGAEIYKLYRLKYSDNLVYPEFVGETTDTEIIIDGLDDNTEYDFIVTGYNENMEDPFSSISELAESIVRIFTHEPIKPLSVVINNRNATIKFSNKVDYNPPANGRFYLYKDEFQAYPNSIVFAGDSTYMLSFDENIEPGLYQMNILPFPDYYNTPSDSARLEIEFEDVNNNRELFLSRLDVVSKLKLRLYFSDAVDIASAENFDNYSLAPAGTIISVEINESEGNLAIIELSPSDPLGASGKEYVLTATGIRSAEGVPLTEGPGKSISFTFFADAPNDAFVYPSPIKLSNIDDIYFANLPKSAEVRIMTLQGELLRTLVENDGNGGVEWDARDRTGKLLKPGVYIFIVKEIRNDGTILESDLNKFIILP